MRATLNVTRANRQPRKAPALQEIPNSETPPLQSFSYGLGCGDLIRRILRVLSPDKQPIFDFSRLSILSFSQTSFDGRDDISLKLLPLVVGLR